MRSLTQTSTALSFTPPQTKPWQRKCATCGQHAIAGDECTSCRTKKLPLQRHAMNQTGSVDVPSIVHEVVRSPGQSLEPASRLFMESRFGHDFSQVRVHTDGVASTSARAVNALAYTVGNHVVFAAGQYAPTTTRGQHLLAHELTHVLQQGTSHTIASKVHDGGHASSAEANADAVADAVLAGRPIGAIVPNTPMVQRRAAPYIKKIMVHLAPPQTADLEWQGTPPASATGSDHFTVSTGKGYSDPGDPPGTCTRTCCRDALTQCAPPWNQPTRVGACCTYYGNTFWTGTPLTEHNGWRWWTPIQPYYSSRGIALHQHTTVTGQPIGHGCVRMEDANAQRIYDFSNGRRTNVTIDGRAAPVACDASQQCGSSSGSGTGSGTGGTRGALEDSGSDVQVAALEDVEAVPGLEGVMS